MEDECLRAVTQADAYDLRGMMERYGEDVWNYAFFLTKRRDMADDIAQDTFLKAYAGITSFRGEASLKTWLLKIARNTALSHKKCAFFRNTTLKAFIERFESHPSAEEEFIERNATDELWTLVLQLPVPFREVLVLNSHYSFSLEEIAQTLGISLGTVKSRLHRAGAKLAAAMGRRDPYG